MAFIQVYSIVYTVHAQPQCRIRTTILTCNVILLTGGITSCSPIDIPECLTPTLEDHNLSEMLVMVANQDKDYVGCNMLSRLTHGSDVSEGTIPKLVGQTLVIIITP